MKNISIATLAAGSLFFSATISNAADKEKQTNRENQTEKELDERTDQIIWEMFYAPEEETKDFRTDGGVSGASLGSGR